MELDAGFDTAQTVEHGERLRAVMRAIAALPGQQRAAMVLREFEGLTYEELAAVLDTSVPASRDGSTGRAWPCSRRQPHGDER